MAMMQEAAAKAKGTNSVEREVRVSMLCRTQKIGQALGRNQSNINRIRSKHPQTQIEFTIQTGYSVFTISAMDTFSSRDPTFYAAYELLPYCSYVLDDGRHRVVLLIDDSQEKSLDVDFVNEWILAEGGTLVISEKPATQEHFVTIEGPKDAVTSAFVKTLFRMRRSLFRLK